LTSIKAIQKCGSAEADALGMGGWNAALQAPAEGRLAAAIATIRESFFPIRDRVERSKKLIRRIGFVLPRQPRPYV